ncbi:hypothetical protein QE408_003087 [Agrobacterium larrymoorei]|uniref:Uncharacterized protein n=1 Tax=Agrobacterium larrymoorei TaxID=160699 RepID=A0ABU0ULW9_9HYPH|nr:hypothetical protein [Agrobacterium larrymoorei]
MRYGFRWLIGYQLPWPDLEGDRHHLDGRPGRRSPGRVRYAPPAWLAAAPGRGAFPRSGGHPTPWGGAPAHRSHFSQWASSRFQGAIWSACAAFDLLRLGVGVRVGVVTAPLPALLGVGGNFLSRLGEWIGKRAASTRKPAGLQLSADLLRGRRACAMRAPAAGATVGANQ